MRINRFYWIAIALFVIVVGCIIAIWCIDFSDPTLEIQVDLSLKVFGAVVAILGVVFTAIGVIKKQQSKDTSLPIHPSNFASVANSNLEESIAIYLSNLERILSERTPSSKFVEPSTEAQHESCMNELELMQDFQWSQTELKDGVDRNTREPINFLEAHTRFQRYVLLGDPGAGKTTCLHYLTQLLIQQYRSGASSLLPLYATLSDWQDHRVDVLTFLKDTFSKIAGPNSALIDKLESLLSLGHVIVILDGLNEMPGRRSSNIQAKTDAADHHNFIQYISSAEALRSNQDPRERSLRALAMLSAVRSHFIISCRTHEYFQSPSWQEVYILPMNDEQIHRFIQKYMSSIDAIALSEQIDKTSPLKDLARNPFFLRSMIMVSLSSLLSVQNKGQFLERLYGQLINREQARGASFSIRRLTKIVSYLAFKMMCKDMIGSQVDLRKMAKLRETDLTSLLGTGLIVRRQNNIITFYHQLIQEFFAAVYLRDTWRRPRLVALLYKKKWSEVIVLWCQIATSPTKLLEKLLFHLKERNHLWLKPKCASLWHHAFTVILWNAYAFLLTNLLLDVLTGGKVILPLVVTNPAVFFFYAFIVPICLMHVWLMCFRNWTVIGNTAYVLGKIHHPIAIDFLISAFDQTQGVFTTECRKSIASALACFGSMVVPRLIAELSSMDNARRKGCIIALGIIGDRRAVDPLLGILREGHPDLLQVTGEALGRIGDPKAGLEIAQAIGNVKIFSLVGLPLSMMIAPVSATMKEFREFDQTILDRLSLFTEKDRPFACRVLAVQALGYYGYPSSVPLLTKIARDPDEVPDIMINAITLALSLIRGREGVRALVQLYDESQQYKSDVLKALGKVRNLEALPGLYLALKHPVAAVRAQALQSIGLIGDNPSSSQLKELLQDPDKSNREQLAWTLGRIADVNSINTLKELCIDRAQEVRIAALQSLDCSFPDDAKIVFLTLARDHTYPERGKAIDLLAQYRFPDVKQALLKLCADPDDKVKQQAIESMRHIDSTLTQELKLIGNLRRGNIIQKLLWAVVKALKITDLKRLMREEKIKGTPDQALWSKVQQRIFGDAELSRHFRLVKIVFFGLLMFMLFVFPGILTALACKGLIVAGNALWSVKWYMAVVVVAGIFSWLPRIRRGRSIRFLGITYSIVRSISVLIVVVLLGALMIKYLWISVPLVLLLAIITWICIKRMVQKKRMFPNF